MTAWHTAGLQGTKGVTFCQIVVNKRTLRVTFCQKMHCETRMLYLRVVKIIIGLEPYPPKKTMLNVTKKV